MINYKKIPFLFHLLILVSLIILSSPDPLVAFGGCEQDCLKCHSLTIEEARELLRDFDPNITIENVQTSPSPGLWEIAVESKGKKSIAYLDFSKENLIIGTIVKIKTKKNLTRERLIELNRVDVSLIPLDDALVIGDRNAKHRLIVFDDPD